MAADPVPETANNERQAEIAGRKLKCPHGACDQVRPCAFYCWWRPTMAALNHEAKQYGCPLTPSRRTA